MNFERGFQELTGNAPYPWQSALYRSLIEGDVPHRLGLPTGAGKTSVIPVWLCGIWHELESGLPLKVPRRLFFAVDRRIVVDQSEVTAQQVKKNAERTPLWDLLAQKTLSDDPLIVSVLRGQRVLEYDDIVSDPSAFAVILCTPDMIFSRLLGGAYGCSHRLASREMGLVGQDTFIVLDEAHISEANVNVLEFVSQHNRSLKPFWWTTMSATLRQSADFTLSQEDLTAMSGKLNAHKIAKVSEVESKQLVTSVLDTIAQHAEPWKRLIVYVEKPADANRLYEKLRHDHSCTLLTGTMRGYEKSKLDFSPFKQNGASEKHILICTSAGEVGLEVSCEFMITESASGERLAQRFGRCNRWNESQQAHIYVINPTKQGEEETELSPKQSAIKATVEYLKSLADHGWADVSTGNLYDNPLPAETFSPVPASLSLNKASLIQIANTTYPSLDMSDFIRGASAEYHVNLIVRKDEEIARMLSLAARDPTNEAFDQLVIANNELFKEPSSQQFIKKLLLLELPNFLFISKTGDVMILEQAAINPRALVGGTLFLPESSKPINAQGLFEPHGDGEGDVFSKVQNTVIRFIQFDDQTFTSLETGETVSAVNVEKLAKAIPAPAGMKSKVVFNAGGLVYVKAMKRPVGGKMTCREHTECATGHAQKLTHSLALSDELAAAIVNAATHHDDGKTHDLWQLAFRGTTTGEALAKNYVFRNPALLNGLRHELVSALYNRNLSPLEKWLVVSHHGRCRSHFPETAYDRDMTTESAELNEHLPVLLADLNFEHGVWGLAYLEAVVRAVDINAE
ncbi:MAG TPA: type I-U CRISPR-associated helicase/endonuclease Cas3 [Candidatus Sulfotelmatobacter sp.]|nr:type I-U CRISPR-associated helicase/endonuclease Cas3 [Candidatus Sulfotelmatobacter sp.]